MKIALISPSKPIGGIASWTKEVMSSKYKKNFILIDTGKKQIKNKYLKIIFDIICTLKVVLKCAYLKNIDIAHINSSCSLLGMLREYLWIRILKIKGIPICIEFHCDVSIYCNNLEKRKIIKKIIDNSNIVLVLNKPSEKFIQQYTKTKVICFKNFINDNTIEEYKYITKNRIHKIIYLGRIRRDKGAYIIYELSKRINDIEFELVGPNEDNIQFNSNNCHILDSIQKNEVISYLRTGDLFLLPSYAEGFPMVFLEAMNSGIPILTNKVGPVDIIFTDDVNKRYSIVNNNLIDDFVDKINKLQDKNIRKEISKNNYFNLINKYTTNICVKELIEIYENAI